MLPIQPHASWDEAKKFTQTIAQQMAKARPDRYVATIAKASRRGRIFIDFLEKRPWRDRRRALLHPRLAIGLGVNAACLG